MKMLYFILIISFLSIAFIGALVFNSQELEFEQFSLNKLNPNRIVDKIYEFGHRIFSDNPKEDTQNTETKLGKLSIKSPKKSWIVLDSNDNYSIFIDDRDSRQTEITFCHNSMTPTQSFPLEKEGYSDEELITPIPLQSIIKDGKVCYQRLVQGEDYVKLNPIVTYQDINKLEYDLGWANTNITLYKNISGDWNNTVNDIWVTLDEDTYKFGANDSSNTYPIGDLEVYRYTLNSNKKIFPNNNLPYVKRNVKLKSGGVKEERHKFTFGDICDREFNLTGESADCIFNYYTKVVGTENVTGSNGEEITNDITHYFLDVTFNSDKYIDPLISIDEFTFFNSILLNITQENNFTHLTMNDDSLQFYYPFDVNSSPTIYDYTSNNNDALINGNLIYNSSCLYGNCIELNGIDYLTAPNNPSLNSPNISQEITMSLWIRRSAQLDVYDTVLSKGANSQYLMNFRTTGGLIGAYVGLVGGFTTSTTELQPNVWYHVAYTYNDSQARMYVNGVLEDTKNGLAVIKEASNDLYVGRYASGQYYNGSLDEIMMLDSGLSASEILDIYNNQSTRFLVGGTQTFKNFNITTGNNTINITTHNFQTHLGSNLEVRLGEWDISQGYNDSINGTAEGYTTNDELIVYYHFDNISSRGENDTHAFDWSGNNNNGTAFGGFLANESGKYDGAFGFDGSGDYVDFTTPSDIDKPLNDIPNLTFMAWAKPNSCQAYGAVVCFGDTFDFEVSPLGDSVNSFGIWVNDQALTGTYTSCLDHVGKWVHLAVTKNGNNYSLFMNGEHIGSEVDTDNLDIGSTSHVGTNGGGSYFDGNIDEVIVWNRSITQEELTEIYAKGRLNYNYLDYQDVSSVGDDNNFTISNSSEYILPQYRFTAGNTTNPFYSPILEAGIDFDLYSSEVIPSAPPDIFNLTELPTDPNDWDASQRYKFNATVTDDVELDTVIFSFNGQNYSGIYVTNVSSEYSANIGKLSGGNYSYYWWANDTDGNINSTASTYNVTKNPNAIITFKINDTLSTDSNYSATNNSLNIPLKLNRFAGPTSLRLAFYVNGTHIGNGTGSSFEIKHNFSIGYYNVTGVSLSSDNYSTFEKIAWVNITAGPDLTNPDVNITFPINNTLHTNTGLNVNFTRSDSNLESCWYSNDTYSVNTTLASCGNITAVTWSLGLHNVTVWANDSSGNEGNSKISFRIIPIDKPTFDNLINHTIEANTSFQYDLDATDTAGIDTFVLNDTTNFNITRTGIIRNVTQLNNIAIYWLNVTVNDTTNMYASGVFFINVTLPPPPVISDLTVVDMVLGYDADLIKFTDTGMRFTFRR